MSGAIHRVYKQVQERAEEWWRCTDELYAYDWMLRIISEELEKDAEKEFTRPINPDPVTGLAKQK